MPLVLLAEDHKINQIVAAGTLKKLGYEVDIVQNGREAVEACTAVDYVAVLMDVMMPEMDGYQAVTEIRRREQAAGLVPVPVIGLSARSMDSDRRTALEAGMNDYLTKPLRTTELAAALGRWVDDTTVSFDPVGSI